MNTKSLHAHYFRRRNKAHKPGVNAYPLLGILLLFVTAALAYGVMYLVLFA